MVRRAGRERKLWGQRGGMGEAASDADLVAVPCLPLLFIQERGAKGVKSS